jgi:CheY-like chemotaxis protein
LQDNGVTGYVAATGRSYLCPDTTRDPLYLEGAYGARSSLTVPLLLADEVVGTFNVESPRPNAFTAEDLQFTELFGREVAHALHTLQLLSAQESCTAIQSIEAINREVALPADQLLALAGGLLVRIKQSQVPMAAEWVNVLQQILADARVVKSSIQKVGEQLAAAAEPAVVSGVSTAALRGMRILVVDGEERTRRAAHTLLERFGSTVETAATATEAIALASTATYDAIIQDIRLPDLGGYETYRRLKAAQPGSRIILMSGFGYDSGHAIVKARGEGLRHVIYKPFRTDQVVNALVGPAAPGPPPGPTSPPHPVTSP